MYALLSVRNILLKGRVSQCISLWEGPLGMHHFLKYRKSASSMSRGKKPARRIFAERDGWDQRRNQRLWNMLGSDIAPESLRSSENWQEVLLNACCRHLRWLMRL
jgi:hypothetical protein